MKGNIGLFDPPSSLALSKVAGILTKLDVANTIVSKRILPTKPAIRAHKELSAISEIIIFLGQKDILFVF